MSRFTRATRRTRLLLGIIVAFTLLFMCGVADDNDRGAAARPTPAASPSAGESSDFSAAQAAAAAAPDFTASESEVLGGGRSVSVRGDSSAAVVVAAVGMVHHEAVEQRQDAAVWQGQAVTVVGLVGLTVFAVIVAVVGRKLYRSRRDRRNGESGTDHLESLPHLAVAASWLRLGVQCAVLDPSIVSPDIYDATYELSAKECIY